jgi:hypothetical protein
LHNHIPSADILRRAVLGADAFSFQQLRLDGGDDFLRNLILQLENVCKVAIVTVSPNVVVRFGVD